MSFFSSLNPKPYIAVAVKAAEDMDHGLHVLGALGAIECFSNLQVADGLAVWMGFSRENIWYGYFIMVASG